MSIPSEKIVYGIWARKGNYDAHWHHHFYDGEKAQLYANSIRDKRCYDAPYTTWTMVEVRARLLRELGNFERKQLKKGK